ncbi:MAG: hypothetical protein ACRCST_08050 [Turicibacter sp.]
MEKKTKSISQFLTDDELISLTNEAFTSHKVHTFKVTKFKPLLIMAASLILIIGLMNVETISAKTEELFAYIFGTGIGKQVDLSEYYVLDEAIMLSEGSTVLAAYRQGSTLTVVIEGDVNPDAVTIKVKGKQYRAAEGKSVSINTVSDQETASLTSTQFIFNSLPKRNEITLLVADESYELLLKQPAGYEMQELYQTQIGQHQLLVLPLSTNNDRLAIDYDIPQVGKVAWTPWLHGSTFIDEAGESFWVSDNGLNPFEIFPVESLGGKIVKLSGPGIKVQKDFHDLKQPLSISLPNPKTGETVILDQVFDIDGIGLRVHSISRDGDAVTVVINKETTFGTLDNVFYQAEISSDATGYDDDQYFYTTYDKLVTDKHTLTFTINGIIFESEQPYEIIFK